MPPIKIQVKFNHQGQTYKGTAICVPEGHTDVTDVTSDVTLSPPPPLTEEEKKEAQRVAAKLRQRKSRKNKKERLQIESPLEQLRKRHGKKSKKQKA